MARHTLGDLKQMQSLPLDAKVQMTKQRIKAWYDHYDGDVHVSFSGGKDSTVLKHIVDSMYDDVPSVFVDTGLEYPEIRQFVRKQKNVEIVRPRLKFYEVVETYGFPVVSKKQAYLIGKCQKPTGKNEATIKLYTTGIKRDGTAGHPKFRISKKWLPLVNAPFKVSNKCCDIMKKDPIFKYQSETGRFPIIGTMTHESDVRQRTWLEYGCNAFEKDHPTSQPMSFWTEQDVLQYIKENNIEIASVYGDIVTNEEGGLSLTGVSRTGCMFCAFGAHLEQQPNRFQRMQKTHPKQWNYCMDKLGMRDVLEFCGIPYEDKQLEMFEVTA